jgi:hypothetical protein
MAYREFDFINTEVNRLQNFPLDSLCNAVMITNTGTTLALVNNFPLHPGTPGTDNGEALIIGGNEGEILKTQIQIRFPNNTGAVMVTQKVYRK